MEANGKVSKNQGRSGASSTSEARAGRDCAVRREIRFVTQPTETRLDLSVEPINGPVYLSLPLETQTVTIANARRDPSLGLEASGFELQRWPTRFGNATDISDLRGPYLDELALRLQSLLGAARVVPRRNATYIRMTGSQALVDSYSASGQPASFAHIDFAHSEPARLARLEDELQGFSPMPYSRLMVIQVWRPLTPPPQDQPLSICDARTLAREDTVEQVARVGSEEIQGNVFRTLKVRYNPAQRWFYYPDMTPDEVIIFKGYDSDPNAAWRVGHAAFDNRERDPDAIPRRSVEARFFVYFQ